MILTLDIGIVRVGYVISENNGNITESGTLKRANKVAENFVLNAITQYSITLLVAGIPLSDNETESEQVFDINKFINRILKRSEIEVVYVDEYNSSVEAKEKIYNEGRKIKSKEIVDEYAAKIILNRYLELNK